jgi:hypothetical protein
VLEPATATAQFRMPTSFDAPDKTRPRKCLVTVRQCSPASLHSPNQSVPGDRHRSFDEALPRA